MRDNEHGPNRRFEGGFTHRLADCGLDEGRSSDDLWRFGKPQGWGAVWFDTPIKADQPSDPFLMTGFEHKCVHLTHDAAEPVTFTIEVDFQGNGSWRPYETVRLPAKGYRCHIFPEGFSAHWVRVAADKPCTAAAQFVYT